MLRKFRVSNFKSFNENFELDLTQTNSYKFNNNSIKNGVVNNAIIYGHNGVGKSNLSFAIFDIIEHLTEKERIFKYYKNYLNAFSKDSYATFYYEFNIKGHIVQYEYKKSDYKTIISEKLLIDGKDIVVYDRENDKVANVALKGAEMLQKKLVDPKLSILKYIKSNTVLVDNQINDVFNSFFVFIDKMLFFRTLSNPQYLGFEIGTKNVLRDIVEKRNVAHLESFLNEANISCHLVEGSDLMGDSTIMFDLGEKKYPFSYVASTGTKVLVLFYYWYQKIKENDKVSFVFIDEFDAFYHQSLSKLIVKKLKETGVQFILTTHNTSIMSNDLLRPDCYFLMNKKEICSLSNCTEKDLREAHNLEKMYKANSFHLNE